MRTRFPNNTDRSTCRRTGAATLDYILVMGIILPLAAVVIPAGKHVLELVYEMTCVLVAWPFL